MKNLRTLALAATLALIGMAGGARAETGQLTGQTGQDAILIGLLLPAVQKAPEAPGDGRADLVAGAGGGGASGVTKTGRGTLVLSGANTFGSLRGLGSTQDLFANSRGGDRAAGAHGAGGGGGAGKVAYQDLHATAKPGDGSVMPTDQLTGNANPKPTALLLPAVQAAREAARRASSSTGATGGGGGQLTGGQIAGGGAAKGINVPNSARK